MSIADDRRPTDVPDGLRPLHVQFKEWRERDWFVLGYPPERPSPYWFSLAHDAIWMTLSIMERGLSLMERMTLALEFPPKPKDEIGALPAVEPTSGGE